MLKYVLISISLIILLNIQEIKSQPGKTWCIAGTYRDCDSHMSDFWANWSQCCSRCDANYYRNTSDCCKCRSFCNSDEYATSSFGGRCFNCPTNCNT